MKMTWTDVRRRLGLVAIVLTGFFWYKSGGSWMWVLGPVGLLVTMLLVVKMQRDVALGTVAGWGYWLFAAWKGQEVRLYFLGVAEAWDGDGSMLTSLCAFAAALVYVAAVWSLADRNVMELLHKVAPESYGKKMVSEAMPKDWETVTFVLGEDVTNETFRLGGE